MIRAQFIIINCVAVMALTTATFASEQTFAEDQHIATLNLNLEDSATQLLDTSTSGLWDILKTLKNVANGGINTILGSYAKFRPWLIWLAEKAGKDAKLIDALEASLINDGLNFLIPVVTVYLTEAMLASYLGADPTSWLGWAVSKVLPYASGAAAYIVQKALEISGRQQEVAEGAQKRLVSKLEAIMQN